MNPIKQKNLDRQLLKRNVNGYGHWRDEDGRIPIFVTRKYDEPTMQRLITDDRYGITEEDRVDEEIPTGVVRKEKTKVVEIGEVKAFAGTGARREHNPIPGGVEIGPQGKNWVGTVGMHAYQVKVSMLGTEFVLYGVPAWLEEKLGNKAERIYKGITNRHVMLSEYNNTNSLQRYYTQPGHDNENAYQASTVSNTFDIDTGILDPLKPVKDSHIYRLGNVIKAEDPQPGDTVYKMGRTTGLTSGTCQKLYVTVRIDFGGQTGVQTMRGLHMFTNMSQRGDSGSAIVKKTPEGLVFVGLLNAGSDKVTFAVPPHKVLQKTKTQLEAR